MVPEREFNALLVKYRPYIVRQVGRNGGDATEDYVQDVMLHVCRGREGFDPDRGAFVTWLFWQIRSCLQQRRAYHNKRRAVSHSMEYHEDGEPLTEAVALGNQQAHVELRETLEAIGGLKPRQAHAVLQSAVGATFGEIAQAYGATAQYAQELHRTGLNNLRKQMNRRAAMAGAVA